MGLFTRRQHDGPTTGWPATEPTKRTPRRSLFGNYRNRAHNSPRELDMSRRPPFGLWLKATWVDLATMIVMGIIGIGVYTAPPAPSRSFPVYFQDGEIVYPQFAYPLRKEIVPIWAAALLACLVPVAVFCIVQIRVRSFWDLNNAIIGLLYSLITAAVFQVFLKWLIGGLRPHFLTVCAPSIPATGTETGKGFGFIMYDRSICTGDQKQINDSLESFPSGHTTATFASFVFLSLYLNAKLKTFANYHPAMWKLIATYAPILGATLIGGSLTIDEFHNWYDCLAGAIIGTVMAFSSYRMLYASIWDFRFNHIPLNRLVPFAYGHGQGELENAVWTRKAGWGVDAGAFGGAPGDSGSRGSGITSGVANGHWDSRDGVGVLGHHQHQRSGTGTTIDRKAVGSGNRVTGDAMV